METQKKETEWTKAELALAEAGQMSIRGSSLLFLMQLFRTGQAILQTDDKGFGFTLGSDFYPIEIYEDGHWDNSLNQSLGHRKRTAGK
jgi:hypothetical protein